MNVHLCYKLFITLDLVSCSQENRAMNIFFSLILGFILHMNRWVLSLNFSLQTQKIKMRLKASKQASAH